jgi:hypothetical protein
VIKINWVPILNYVCNLKRVIVLETFLIILLSGCSIKSTHGSYAAHTENNYKGCPNKINGSRIGYHSSNDIWVSDCDNPLDREYWRVFEKDKGAYIIPRPDSSAYSNLILCENSDKLIMDLVFKYEICDKPLNKHKINSMPIGDALLLTHYLNSKLKFKVLNGQVFPSAIPADILAACQIRPHIKEFESECTRFVQAYGCGVLDLEDLNEQFILGESHFPELDCVTPFVNILYPRIIAKRLNLLYGVR